MSAMAEMSKAIRTTIENHSGATTLTELSDEDLGEFVAIVGAFYFDLKGEADRRAQMVSA